MTYPMTNTRVFFLGLCILMLLSGCFEIIEEINLRKDGSGELMLTVDLSESALQVRQYLEAGEVDGKPLPSRQRMESMLEELKARLSKAPGLHGVVVQSNWDRYVFKIRCGFRRVEDLDAALLEMAREAAEQHDKTLRWKPNFRFQNGVFTRFFDFDIDPTDFDRLPATRKRMLESARYIVIYRFEQAIADFNNKAFQLSPSGKALMLQTTPADVLSRRLNPANRITLSR